MSKEFDVVIYGATSFTGEIIVAHMVENYSHNSELSWALAGRSEAKLLAVKERVGATAVPHIIADSNSEDQLRDMTSRAKVVLTTVGPFALYGEPLLKVCAETGTDYCDLTGEVQWYRRMLSKYEQAAKESGARILLCSGFDSIPSDMGVYYLQKAAKQQFGEYCFQVKNRVERFRGGASGGSAMSFINLAKELANDPVERREMKNPYALCPQGHGFNREQNEVDSAQFDDDFDSWIGTFLMAKVNTRVVHRSNAISGNIYGEDFLYDEAQLTGGGSKGRSRARKLSWGFRVFMLLGSTGPTRKMLERFLPKSGEGPSLEEQVKGRYSLQFFGRTRSNRTIRIRVTGDRDPGYGSTAKIIAESAICIASIPETTPGGFWTPSTLYGPAIIDRLEQNAGIRFEVM